jgi:hypothetical protein
MRSQKLNDQVEVEEFSLKFTVVKIFQALLEGRQQGDPHIKRVLGMVHHDILVGFVDSPVLKVELLLPFLVVHFFDIFYL